MPRGDAGVDHCYADPRAGDSRLRLRGTSTDENGGTIQHARGLSVIVNAVHLRVIRQTLELGILHFSHLTVDQPKPTVRFRAVLADFVRSAEAGLEHDDHARRTFSVRGSPIEGFVELGVFALGPAVTLVLGIAGHRQHDEQGQQEHRPHPR